MTLQDKVKNLMARLQALEPAWFQRTSWVNESVGGMLGTGLLLGLGALVGLRGTWRAVMAVLVFNGLSAVYEWCVDPSEGAPQHVPLDDFGQRAAGSVLLAWLACLLF